MVRQPEKNETPQLGLRGSSANATGREDRTVSQALAYLVASARRQGSSELRRRTNGTARRDPYGRQRKDIQGNWKARVASSPQPEFIDNREAARWLGPHSTPRPEKVVRR